LDGDAGTPLTFMDGNLFAAICPEVAGTHGDAIGADAHIGPKLFTRATVVVDKPHQRRDLRYLQHLSPMGLMQESDMHAEPGQIAAGKKPGRTEPDQITIFDATGVSFQDTGTARLAYQQALELGWGWGFDWG